jgi:hypothetical protein
MDSAVREYLDKVPSATRRRDAETLLELMGRVTGEPARMWGSSILGFGQYHWHYQSGREGDGPASSFSPRKAAMTVYLPDGAGAYAESLSRLGPHTVSVGCLYLKDLAKVDLGVLEEIIGESYRTLTSGTYTNRAADHR